MSLGEGWQRTHTCGALRSEHAATSVTLNGWVAARRDHGGIYFVDLRDRYGLTQVVLSEEVVGELKLAPEDVLCVRGEVRLREERNINPNRETGKVEVLAIDDRRIYLRYHQAKDPANLGRFMVYRRDDDAYWLDQLELDE